MVLIEFLLSMKLIFRNELCVVGIELMGWFYIFRGVRYA